MSTTRIVRAAVGLVLFVGLASPAGAATRNVSIVDNSFNPASITIHAGDTVVWSQNGQNPHTVTADDGSFDSGTLDPGATYSRTFGSAGTFPYYCKLHGAPGGTGMSGTITVTSAGQPSPTPTATGSALPRTGTSLEVGPFLGLAGLLLVVGSVGLYAARRRTSR